MPKFEFNPRTGQMEIKKPTGIEFFKVGGGLKVTDHDLPAAMGWLFVQPVAGDTELIEKTAKSILERWRKAARKRLQELLWKKRKS